MVKIIKFCLAGVAVSAVVYWLYTKWYQEDDETEEESLDEECVIENIFQF